MALKLMEDQLHTNWEPANLIVYEYFGKAVSCM